MLDHLDAIVWTLATLAYLWVLMRIHQTLPLLEKQEGRTFNAAQAKQAAILMAVVLAAIAFATGYLAIRWIRSFL